MITSAKEFVELRTSATPKEYLRAATDSAPIEVWSQILKERPDMKVWVARNKTVPVQILEQLALDSDPDVRCAVAMKNKLTAELMLTLARDTDPSVRQRITYNKNAGRELLQLLAQDPVARISKEARGRLASLEA